MSRIILIPAICICLFSSGKAQNLLSKVPATSSMVMKYAGENFSKNLPLKKLDTYSFVKNNLFKTLKIDTLTSLQNIGINFEKDTYQYLTMEDSAMSFVSLINLNDVSKFLKLIDANYHAEMKPEKKNGFEFLSLSPTTYIGWNNEQAVLVVSSYQNPNRYNYYQTMSDSVSTMAMADTAIKFTSPKLEKIKGKHTPAGKIKKPMPAGTVKKGAKASAKKPTVKKKPVEIIDEEVKPDVAIGEYKMSHEDSLAQEKREEWYREQDKITAARQRLVAENIINNSFNGNIVSIATDVSYSKVIEPAAHVTVWFNYQNLLMQYYSSIFRVFGGYTAYNSGNAKKGNNDGFRSGMNIFFEKDKMRIEQKAYSPDEKMTGMGKDVFNSKQSIALVNYVNPDNIGYLSMSINSEAMTNYYYKIMRQYLDSYPYINEYSGVVDVYMDLVEIVIDEKAIAELMPGNYMFVLHDMKTKKVTYTDYEYNEKDFKTKEVIKTKQELSPNFTFVMETKKEGFMQKIANLPLKYAEKEKYNYKDRGGYYELVFDSGKYPLSSLYFMVKNGKAVVTTSKASIDITLNNTGYTLDADTKNSILNNNYSLKINSKKLLGQISPELSTGVNRKISSYLQENMGDVKMESTVKDGIIQGTTTMSITGNHANSLEFFFNIFDAINNIIEKDKQEREQKFN